jgi:CheY-like chemotaxis protein
MPSHLPAESQCSHSKSHGQESSLKTASKNKRILIVDDEPNVAFTFKVALEENGSKGRVEAYNDPSLALADFESGSYVLLLLDMAMPRMDGFTLYEKIRKIDSKIKVFFITAFGVNYEVSNCCYSF